MIIAPRHDIVVSTYIRKDKIHNHLKFCKYLEHENIKRLVNCF